MKDLKILICCDMEGISGVVDWNHVDPEHPEYQRFRRMMTADINAAICGAYEGGASNVLVTDGHENKLNILYEELDGRASLNCGSDLPLAIAQGVETGVDGAFFIGFHARYGSPDALLSHTWSGVIRNLWLNDILVGETGLIAAVCGHFNVPVIMISGDDKVCLEAQILLPGVETAVVKRSLGRLSASCFSHMDVRQNIRTASVRAVERLNQGDGSSSFILKPPIRMSIELMEAEMMAKVEKIPETQRLDDTRLEFTASDMLECFRVFREYNRLGSL